MVDGNFTDLEVEDAINNMIISLDMTLDNNVAILNNYVFNVYDNLPMIEDRKLAFKNVKKEDIVKVAKKVKLNTVFALEGKSE